MEKEKFIRTIKFNYHLSIVISWIFLGSFIYNLGYGNYDFSFKMIVLYYLANIEAIGYWNEFKTTK